MIFTMLLIIVGTAADSSCTFVIAFFLSCSFLSFFLNFFLADLVIVGDVGGSIYITHSSSLAVCDGMTLFYKYSSIPSFKMSCTYLFAITPFNCALLANRQRSRFYRILYRHDNCRSCMLYSHDNTLLLLVSIPYVENIVFQIDACVAESSKVFNIWKHDDVEERK